MLVDLIESKETSSVHKEIKMGCKVVLRESHRKYMTEHEKRNSEAIIRVLFFRIIGFTYINLYILKGVFWK